MPVFCDTHAHLDYPDFSDDLQQVIQRAQEAGIMRIVTIGTDLASSARAIQISEQYPCVYAAVGWHPADAQTVPDDLGSALRQLARHPKVVAVGETGLDYHRLPSSKPGSSQPDDEKYKRKQMEVFRAHLEVAAELGLNCVVHQRDSFEDVLSLAQQYAPRVRCVFHCFANDAVAARRIIEMWSIVSFTGIVTFKNGKNVRDTLAAVPLDKFMLETDCPFLAPAPYRGKRCEPAHISEIAQMTARIKGCSLEQLSAATCATAQWFFPKLGQD